MSGNTGAAIARIGFAVVGNFIAPGIGGVIGSAIGGLLFPGELPDAFGPRLGPDQPLTSAIIGQAIPIIYGTIDVNGNVIQDLGRVEIENKEEAGGKGGPSQEITTYTYTRTYAVMLCEGPIDGVLRIWRNAKLKYDIRPQQEGESDADFETRQAASTGFADQFALYLGDDEQLPDPVLEADTGIGNQPAYRGRAYIVFYDEDVTDNGGRTSAWKFEVVSAGAFDDSEEVEYAVPALYDWDSEGADPRHLPTLDPYGRISGTNTYRYSFDPEGGTTRSWYDTVDEALTYAESEDGREYEATPAAWELGNFADSTPDYSPWDNIDFADYENRPSLTIHYNFDLDEVTDYRGNIDETSGDVWDRLFAAGVPAGEIFHWSGVTGGTDWNAGQLRGGRFRIGFPSLPGWVTAYTNCTTDPSCPYYDGGASKGLWQYGDAPVGVTRYPGPPNNPCFNSPYLPENNDYCVIGGSRIERDQEWVDASIDDGYKTLLPYLYENNSTVYTGTALGVYDLPQGPIRPIGHADDIQAFWEAEEANAVSLGLVPAGRTYNASGAVFANRLTQYPVITSHAYNRVLESQLGVPQAVTLASIVTDVCRRCTIDPSEIDVSDLTETVQGYRIDRPMTGRAAITPLQSYGYFDCVDAEVLKFPTRGKAIVATLDDDTMAAHEAGQKMPPLLEMTRVEDIELPQYLGVKYIMPHADYAVGLQYSQRLITTAVNKTYFEAPIAMSDDKAKQMSEVGLAEAWVGRETYRLSASPEMLALEAADAIVLPLDNELQRAMITSIQGAYPGPLAIEARRDDASVYSSTAVGVASGFTPQVIAIAGLTVYEIIDGPALTEMDNNAGFYLAAYGTGSAWGGASLFESVDGGGEYNLVESVSTASTMGTLDAALPAGPAHIIDEVTTLTVNMGSGTLSSITDAALYAGGNAAFIGAPGRWEVIQFRTATLVETGVYELTGLVRGRRGTEYAIGQSVAGDTFVMCASCTRVQKSVSAIGSPRLYKMVTARTYLESATAQSLTLAGIALECYAPEITADRDASGNITFNIVRRARLGPEWMDYSDVPLNEESERYQIDVYDGDDIVRMIDSTSPSPTYSAADQTTDFGAAVDYGLLSVVVYQLSATVGRGYSTEATL